MLLMIDDYLVYYIDSNNKRVKKVYEKNSDDTWNFNIFKWMCYKAFEY